MKPVVLLFCLALVGAEEIASRYHERVGIPTAARIKQQESMRIVGGLSSFLGEHPFMAGLVISLMTGETSVCGGSLVSHYYVLTGAQCWDDGYSTGRSAQVVLGSVRLFSGGTRILVSSSSVSKHPYYDPSTLANDIALVRTSYVAYTTYIKPIMLPTRNESFIYYSLEAIGFGKTTDRAEISTSYLRDVFVSVISNAECSASYGSLVTKDVICTSGAGGRGPCGGDAGGPLIYRLYSGSSDLLVGVVSFGAASGCLQGHPSGYTKVYSYMNWINRYI